ncbi:hypothetical protein D3C81_1116270 [compost metagenome]
MGFIIIGLTCHTIIYPTLIRVSSQITAQLIMCYFRSCIHAQGQFLDRIYLKKNISIQLVPLHIIDP